MKAYPEAVRVELEGGRPCAVHWRRRVYGVREVQDFWIVQGRWWSREERRLYQRLSTDRGGMELYRSGREWRLQRLVD